MASTVVGPDDVGAPGPEGSGSKRRRSWPFWVLGVVVLIVGTVGIFAWRQYRTLTSAEFNVIDYSVPTSHHLVAGTGETIYRIDPTHSELSYEVDEKLFGQDASRAKGTTNGIAGDIAINSADPAKSHLGEIAVNVEQLHSDNNLRDARLRAANLESHKYPIAYLTAGDMSGLPATLEPGKQYHFQMPSQLTIKNVPSAVTWDVVSSASNGKLTATATANVKMSTLGIGPISIAGLVSTSDDVKLTMRLTAVDPSKFAVPNTIAAPASAARSGDSPSFSKVILPAMEANCASCHGAGDVGAAHWQFTTAGDAQKVSDGIGTVVKAGYMPPWPASTAGVALAHSKRLDAKTVDAIVKWSQAGGPLDVPKTTLVHATHGPEGTPPRHDMVLRMPKPYAGSLSTPNDYRCFVLDPHVTKPTFMTGYEVTPGNRAEIHHAQIFQVDASQVEGSTALDGKDGKPGWSCYAGPSLRSTRFDPTRHRVRGNPQGGLVAGWVPGQDPTIYPLHSGILLHPGDALVLQIHYHYNATPVPDRSTVALQLDPGTAPIKELSVVNPIAPVEIPCNPDQTGALCDRDAALADDARLYGPLGSAAEPGLLGICGKTKEELQANFKHGVASTSCDYRVPESGLLVNALGHMHTLGKSFRLTLDPDTPQQKVVLDIPTWNFDWQMNYSLAKAIHVVEGEKIRMECSWDRSLEPNRVPKYIVFAEGTEDEMCFGTYAIIRDDQ